MVVKQQEISEMYDIESSEASDEFKLCWRYAGAYLEQQAGGKINSWLKVELTPPFLEHLSFRLGNQLFYIQIEDVDGVVDAPGGRDGLFYIADRCGGHACLMPMKKIGEHWRPVLPGWGLQDARTQQLINPVEQITNEKIEITDWELQDFAVQVVRDSLRAEGKEVMSTQGNPEIDPSIWFVGKDGPEWVVVRAVRYPENRAAIPGNISKIADGCRKLSPIGHFASVGIANEDAMKDSSATKIYRGYGAIINYRGLEPISQDN